MDVELELDCDSSDGDYYLVENINYLLDGKPSAQEDDDLQCALGDIINDWSHLTEMTGIDLSGIYEREAIMT